MWETVTDYNAHAQADNCILFIKDIHFSFLCHETITGLRRLAPTVLSKERIINTNHYCLEKPITERVHIS